MAHQQEWIGQKFGEYRLERQLGRGTFGVVYLATHIHDQTQAAVKLLHLQITSREDIKDFLNEARAMRLRHPHIVPMLDFGLSSEDVPYLVMEYATGGTLRQRYPKGTRLPLDTLVTYVTQLASALQYAHDHRVIHRDVKPENMLLRADGTILLSDFGVAKVLEQSTVASGQTRVGTPAYMAPEQTRGKPCPASDQYALAVIVYEWLTGQRPFQGPPIAVALQHRLDPPPSLLSLRSDLSPQVEQVISKALAKEPEERFAAIEQFAQALQAAIQPNVEEDEEAAQPNNHSISSSQAGYALRPGAAPTNPSAEVAPTQPLQHTPPSVEPFHSRSVPTTLSSPQTISSAPSLSGSGVSGSAGALPQAKRRSFSKRATLLALLALVVVLASVGGAWVALSQQRQQQSPFSVGTSHMSQIATATASVKAYNEAIAVKGVQFGFDAQHTRYNPYERILSPSNVAKLKLAWTGQTGDRVDSSPAVANGIVYVASYRDNSLYAYKTAGCGKANCEPLWTATTGDNIYSSPAVVHGLVYVNSDDHKLYVYKAEGCGKTRCDPLWTAGTDDYIDSSPTVANNIVYIGNGSGKLYAYKADGCGQTSCGPLWTAQTGNSIDSSPAVANGVVYVGSDDHKLYAFKADGCGQANCAPLWTAQTGDKIFSSPAVVNGIVYVGSDDHKLYAYRAEGCGQASCSPLWTAQTDHAISSSPAVVNGIVYIGSVDSKLYVYKAEGCGETSCPPLWTATTGNSIYSSPTVANGVVYIASGDGNVYAFNAEGCGQANCLPLWKFQTRDSINSAPAVANGRVYIGSGDHKLYAFQL